MSEFLNPRGPDKGGQEIVDLLVGIAIQFNTILALTLQMQPGWGNASSPWSSM